MAHTLSREERRLLRQRGAGFRELKSASFDFTIGLTTVSPVDSLPTPVPSQDGIEPNSKVSTERTCKTKRKRVNSSEDEPLKGKRFKIAKQSDNTVHKDEHRGVARSRPLRQCANKTRVNDSILEAATPGSTNHGNQLVAEQRPIRNARNAKALGKSSLKGGQVVDITEHGHGRGVAQQIGIEHYKSQRRILTESIEPELQSTVIHRSSSITPPVRKEKKAKPAKALQEESKSSTTSSIKQAKSKPEKSDFNIVLAESTIVQVPKSLKPAKTADGSTWNKCEGVAAAKAFLPTPSPSPTPPVTASTSHKRTRRTRKASQVVSGLEQPLHTALTKHPPSAAKASPCEPYAELLVKPTQEAYSTSPRATTIYNSIFRLTASSEKPTTDQPSMSSTATETPNLVNTSKSMRRALSLRSPPNAKIPSPREINLRPKTRPRKRAFQAQHDGVDSSELELGVYLDRCPDPKIPKTLTSQSAFGKVRWRL